MTKKIFIAFSLVAILFIGLNRYLNSGSIQPDNTVWSSHIGRDTTVGILPDQYANYFSYTVVRTSNDIGFKLKGSFPDTRYFSVNVYSLGDNTTQGSIIDYQIEPDGGLPNPYSTDSDSLAVGTQYTINIVPSKYQSDQFENQLPFKDDTRLISIVIRLYDYNVDDFGGVTLPTVEAYKLKESNGQIIANSRRSPKAISLRTIVRNVSLPGMVKRLSHLFDTERHITMDQSQNRGGTAPIPFHAINTDGYIANNDNRYLLAGITQQDDEVYLFKFKPPTYTTGPKDINQTEVRYWSFNLGNAATYNFNGLKDEDALLDENGFVNVIMAKENKEIIQKAKELNYNYMEWNMPWKKGLILFRHMLADSNFEAQIDQVPPIADNMEDYRNVEAQKFMGNYAPRGLKMTSQAFLDNSFEPL